MRLRLSGITLLVLVSSVVVGYAQDGSSRLNDYLFVTAVAWNSDGSKIAAAGIQQEGEQGYLQVIDSQTGDILYQLDPRPGGFTSVTWSPNDRFLAASSYDQSIWIIDLETSSIVTRLRGHQSTVSEVDWSTDGKYLVSTGSWDGLTILWDMDTYKQIREVESTSWYTVGTAFSPNDQQIAIVGEDGIRVYASTNAVSNDPLWTNNEIFYLGAVAWSHVGNQIAIGSQTFKSIADPQAKDYAQLSIIDASNGAIVTNISTEDDTIFGISWSPDDSLIATYSINGFIRIWDVRSGLLLQSFQGAATYPEKLDFSPFGGRLVYGSSFEIRGDDTQPLGDGAVQIIVPAPSTEKLQSILERCGVEASVHEPLAAQITANELEGFIADVSALTDAQMPVGCQADLLAVARALVAEIKGSH